MTVEIQRVIDRAIEHYFDSERDSDGFTYFFRMALYDVLIKLGVDLKTFSVVLINNLKLPLSMTDLQSDLRTTRFEDWDDLFETICASILEAYILGINPQVAKEEQRRQGLPIRIIHRK